MTNFYGIADGSLASISSGDLTAYLDDYVRLGVQWLRTDFHWSVIQAGGASSYNWTAYDAAVTAANARGIQVLGIIDRTPLWALPSGITDTTQAPNSVTDYATFAATCATHYAPMGVHTWEIWNEPNGGTFTPATYTSLLKAAYPAIKAVDATAVVLGGGSETTTTGGGSYSSVDFLTGMYAAGAHGYFDALCHHPYCWGGANAFPFYSTSSNWSVMQDTPVSLRSLMVANGDSAKKIWATEFGTPTNGDVNAATEAQQSALVTSAYNLFHSYNWSGPLFWFTYRDTGTDITNVEDFFGLIRYDESHKPAYAAYQALPKALSTTAPTAGQKAVVQINNSTYQTVTGLKTADLQISTGKYDITDLNGNGWILQSAGLSSYTLKLAGSFDMSDAQQAVLLADIITTPGTTVSWKVWPAGTGGSHFFGGTGIVVGMQPKFDVKAEETVSFDIDGTGAITWT